MYQFTTDGLVIKEQYTGEADRIITVLSRDRGVFRAFAKGARRPKSKLYAGTAKLSFSDFSVYSDKDVNRINEADLNELFIEIRSDIEKLALAEFFCETTAELAPENESSGEYLRLFLNSLHFLAKGTKPQVLIKIVFTLRLLSLAGYMPGLVACEGCGEYETAYMYFNTDSGLLYCENCDSHSGVRLTLGAVSAMRHIVFSEFNRIFSFSLDEQALKSVSQALDSYLLRCTQRPYKTLEFYNSLF